jgi:hypothetical protein
MKQLSPSNSYEEVVSVIRGRNGSGISVPELSQLLGVKTTTLNARFRRAQISVRTIGRTNYVPAEIAINLTALHRYALMGWPTVREASQKIGIKPCTLKARCEKGQLEGHLDLTKRLRINPFELDHVSLATRKPGLSGNGIRFEHKRNERGPLKPRTSTNLAHSIQLNPSKNNFHVPPALPVEIKIVRAADYGLPEMEIPEAANGNRSKHSNGEHKRSGYLSYDPDKICSVSDCFVGKTIHYGQYDGTITKVLDDPFCPRIKVHFREHPHPLMGEVLLAVGKRRS